MFKSKKKPAETGWTASRARSATDAAQLPSPAALTAAEVDASSLRNTTSSAATTAGFDDDDDDDNIDVTAVDDDAYSSGDEEDAARPVLMWRPPTNEAALTRRKSILLGTTAGPLAHGRLPKSAHQLGVREAPASSANNLRNSASLSTMFQRSSISSSSSSHNSSTNGSSSISSAVPPSDDDITWAVPLSRARETGPAARYTAVVESILYFRRRHGTAKLTLTAPASETTSSSAAVGQTALEAEWARRKTVLEEVAATEAQALRDTLEELAVRPLDLADQVESMAAFLETGQSVAAQRIKEAFLFNKRLDGIGDLESTERLLARGRLKDKEKAPLLASTSLRKAAVPQSRLGLSRRIAYGDGDYYNDDDDDENDENDDSDRGSVVSSDVGTPRSSIFSTLRASSSSSRGQPLVRTQSLPSGSAPTATPPSPSTAPALRYPQSTSTAEGTALQLVSVSAAGGVLNSVKDRLRAALTSSSNSGSNSANSYRSGPFLRRGEVVDPATLNRAQRHAYGRLLGALAAQKPRPAALARLLRSSQAQSASSEVSLRLIRTVLFSLFGNPCDAVAEAQLLGLFQLLLAHEFAGGQLGTFMRSNTATTAMLAAYGRRPNTVAVLQLALGDLVREMATSTLSLEVNPLKVYLEIINDSEALTGKPHPTMRREGVTTDMATQHPEVTARLSNRFETLADFVTRLVDQLTAFADRFPYGVRWLTQQLDFFARKSFGDPCDGKEQQQQPASPPASAVLRAARVQCLEGNLSVEELVELEAPDRSRREEDDRIRVSEGTSKETSAAAPDDDDSSASSSKGATEAEITAIVSGFLLLRVINPLLVAPDEGGILPPNTPPHSYSSTSGNGSSPNSSDHVSSRRTSNTKSTSSVTREGKRTLVLVAKVLQTMSSGVAFGSKEKHMEPLNELLESLAPKFKLFLQKVAQVPSNLSDAFAKPDLAHGSNGFQFVPAPVLALRPQNEYHATGGSHRGGSGTTNSSSRRSSGSGSENTVVGSAISITYNELVGLHALVLEDPILLEPGQGTQSDDEVRAALVAIGPSLPLLDDSLDATSHVRVLLPPNPFPPHLAPFGTAEISNSGPIAEPNTGPILPAYSYVSASSNRNRKRKLLLWDQIPPSSDLPRLPTNAATGASTGAGSTFMAKFSSSEVSSWMPHHQMMSSELAREIRILLHSVLMAAVHTSSSGQGENGAVNSIHSTVAESAIERHACDISLASTSGTDASSSSGSSTTSGVGLVTFLKYIIRAAGSRYSSIGYGIDEEDQPFASESEQQEHVLPSVQWPSPSLLLRQQPKGSSTTHVSSYLSFESSSSSSSQPQSTSALRTPKLEFSAESSGAVSEERGHYLKALSEPDEVESRRVFIALGCHTLLRKLRHYETHFWWAIRHQHSKEGGCTDGVSKESWQAELHTWFLEHVSSASLAMANNLTTAREHREIIVKCLREVNTVRSAQLIAHARLCAAADAHIVLEAVMAAATASGGGVVDELDEEVDQLPSLDMRLQHSDSHGGGNSGSSSSKSGGADGAGLGEQRYKFELVDLETWQVVVKSPVPAHETKHIVLKVLAHPQKRPGRIDVAVKVRAGSMHSAWPKKTEVLFMDELRDITGRGGFEVSLFGPKNPLVLNINFLSRFFKRAFVGLR